MSIDPGQAIIFYVVFLLSVTLHEAAHAWVAWLGGDPTAYEGGQVSLDPLPHIQREPWGMVIIPVLSLAIMGWPFGYASAPYDPQWARRYPKRAGLMALAGPASNLLLALLALLIMHLGLASGGFAAPGDGLGFTRLVAAADSGRTAIGIATFLSILFSMNLLLFLLNMIPVPPLDGSAVVALLLPARTNEQWQELIAHPMLAFAGILIAWRVIGALFAPAFVACARLLYGGIYG